MKKRVLIISAFSLAVASNAAVSKECRVVVPISQALRLNVRNAVADARRAAARNDTGLYAVYGFTIIIPGVREDSMQIRMKHCLRLIEGTSDDAKQAEFNTRVTEYAASYNATLLRLLKPNAQGR